MPDNKDPQEKPIVRKGGRNLVLLGIGAILVTFLTTYISLKIYHDSGDIYLDRSRPGFLPEKEENEKDKDAGDYVFPDSGKITEEAMDEYLENLKEEINRINDYSDTPFGEKALTDEVLGF